MVVFTALSAELATMSKNMRIQENQDWVRTKFGQVMHCGWCGEGHAIYQCLSPPDSVIYYGNFNYNQNNPLSNVYKPSWMNHPNFGWGTNQVGG